MQHDNGSSSTLKQTSRGSGIAVDLNGINIRGANDPWAMLTAAVAKATGIDDLKPGEIGLGKDDYVRLQAEERLHEMRGFITRDRVRCRFVRGVLPGFAYVAGPQVLR